jgi:hypothetical protein
MQGKDMALKNKIPHQRIEIVCFLGEIDVQIIGKNVGHFVKTFQPTIIINYCFGATEIGA